MASFVARLLQRLGEVEPGAAAAQALKVPRWLAWGIVLTVATVVVSEAFGELPAHPRLELGVILLDIALVGGFCAWTAIRSLRARGRLKEFVLEERITLLLVALSMILLPVVPRVGATIIIARLAASGLGGLLSTTLGRRIVELANRRPPLAVALSFLGMIALGSVLLTFPAATVDGQGASLVDAAFTMASATSVTGLVVVDTGSYWTPFGLAVITLWIQMGAIGIMALAAAFAVLAGGRLPGRQQEGLDALGMAGMLDLGTTAGLKRLITAITAATIATELLGAMVLFGLWATGLMPLPERYDTVPGAMWWSFFNSLSAFCHAGFVLTPDSLTPYASNTIVNVVFIGLITAGALGFAVIADLTQVEVWRVRHPRAIWKKLHVQTRVVLVATAVLYIGGMLAFLFFEYDNALSGLSVPGKLNAALFQSVTLRSAGFNTVDWSVIGAPMLIIALIFMFIGSAPGSTGGGVRVTTATVVVMAIRAMLRGREDVELFGRTMPKVIVYRSISIVLIAGLMCAVFMIGMTATQDLPFEKVIFETMSAFGTVGLSMGATSELDSVGKWMMTLLMYFGRVGPLTLALAIGERTVPRGFRYPEGRMAVG
jgi:trk system potassium uptake protein TrkH